MSLDQDAGRKEFLENLINHHIHRITNGTIVLGGSAPWPHGSYDDRLAWLLDSDMPLSGSIDPVYRGNIDAIRDEATLDHNRRKGEAELRRHPVRPANPPVPGGNFFNDIHGAVRAKIEWECRHRIEDVTNRFLSLVAERFGDFELDETKVTDHMKEFSEEVAHVADIVSQGDVHAESYHGGY